MPGIVGLITRMPRERSTNQLSTMVEALRHEAFYETGTRIDESLGVYVGWTALKKSCPDVMPFCNERGDIEFVFSGEEYPEPGVAGSLRQRGHSLETGGLSYLVHLYEEEDQNFLRGLNGMFHGFVINRTRGTAMLF